MADLVLYSNPHLYLVLSPCSGERMKTADAVIEMYRAIDLFLDNRFEEAKALAEPWYVTCVCVFGGGGGLVCAKLK